MSGDRQLVREAIAAYFGGARGDAAEGIYYQGGPLNSLGLGTAYPYTVKGAPDGFYTAGQAAGAAFGAVLSVRLNETRITRKALGGAVGGWRLRRYVATCDIAVISSAPFLETAEAGLDDLVDGLLGLIYADRTLGTTNPVLYPPPVNRLITEAGEGPDGISIGAPAWDVIDRGKATGGIAVTFNADTYVMA